MKNCDLKTTETIERYLDGEMDGEELRAFRERLGNDPELARLVMLHKEVNESILDDEIHSFRNKLKILLSVIRSSDNVKRLKTARNTIFPSMQRKIIAAVFMIALLIAAYIIIFPLNDISYDKIYADYYTPYEPDIVVRSENREQNELSLAVSLYQEGKYKSSGEIFNKLLGKKEEYPPVRFYAGLNAMELDKYNEAIKHFTVIIDQSMQPFVVHAEWYAGLCYLKTEQSEKAAVLFEKIAGRNAWHSEEARKILKKLS